KCVQEIEKMNANSQIGMAVYAGKLKLSEAFASILDFEKSNGLIPTIVKDKKGKILMLAYSNRKSLLKTLESKNVWYFSRSRKKLWMKGETSGNYQELVNIKTDCDKDSLILTVKQTGKACHLGKYSCFGEGEDFGLKELYNIILRKINSEEEKSYTRKLAKNPELLKRKIIEEAGETITAQDKKSLIWECSDLFYFILVLMANKGVEINEVERELEGRNKTNNLKQKDLNILNLYKYI
ncbi:MAG: bifunctional phosphoribosyl-AMP cyclohydrolase/phosphoribosyl-ATP diphosphatase HisIE, partial [Minisyncoccales bacterium]